MSALDRTSRSRPKPLEGDAKTRISFVDMGRAIAALLVVYSHIAHPWVQVKGENAPVIEFVETFSSEPMRMATQGIGQVAVPFFFLVSGFIVTPIAMRQGYRKFALNRFIRVYAPLLFVLLLTSAALWAGLEPQSTGQSQELTPWTMFTNWTLVNYILYPQVVLMPVAWTMIIEVLFYLILLALLPVLRRAVWLAIGIELTFVFVVLSSRSELNESWSLFAVNVSYLPILIIGQIVWATTSKKIPLWAGGVFGALAWMLYVYADIIDVGRIDDSYNLAMSIAVMFFLMGYFAEPKLRQFRFWTAMSERSYSIYLLHGLGIFVTLGLLRPTVPFAIALPISLLVTAGLVEISYRGVERPSHELARSLSRRVGNPPKRAADTNDDPGAGATRADAAADADGVLDADGVDADGVDAGHVDAGGRSAVGEPTVRIPADPDGAAPPRSDSPRAGSRAAGAPNAVPPGAVPPSDGSPGAGAPGIGSPGAGSPSKMPPGATRFDATRSEPVPVDPTRSQPLPSNSPHVDSPHIDSPHVEPPRPASPRPGSQLSDSRYPSPHPEPQHSEPQRQEPQHPEPQRAAPEQRPARGDVADPRRNGHGEPLNRGGGRPRPAPDRVEPTSNGQGEQPRNHRSQVPPRRPAQQADPPVEPRREQPRSSNRAQPRPAERAGPPREAERNGGEPLDRSQARQPPRRPPPQPGQQQPAEQQPTLQEPAQRRAERSTPRDPEQRAQERRPEGAEPQRQSPEQARGQSPVRRPQERRVQERRVQPRRPDGSDGPRHAR
ncbi:acyltransferase family protein [Prauserella alba]|uniref:acyltransferase family protein n=1 Tax=Prauserella alba TaxID=176898 RepID=UPI0020A5BBEF|nr:acyltransferase [Prauserella alba]